MCAIYYVESESERDGDTMRRKQNETQPSRALRGLRFGWLVYQYMSSFYPPYIFQYKLWGLSVKELECSGHLYQQWNGLRNGQT